MTQDIITAYESQLIVNDRRFRNLYAAARVFGSIEARSARGYWMCLHKIYKDRLWESAGHFDGSAWTPHYEDQEDWINELAHLPSREGGCPRSTFYEKMRLIDAAIAKQISIPTVSHMIGAAPGALRKLVDAPVPVPELPDVAQEIATLPSKEAYNAAVSITGGIKRWMADFPVYYDGTGVLEFTVCVQDYGDGLHGEVKERIHQIRNMELEDARWLCRLAHRDMEVR